MFCNISLIVGNFNLSEYAEVLSPVLVACVLRVQGLQTKICQSKAQYAQSLRNLEEISESIHARRKYAKQRHHQDCLESVHSLAFDLGKVPGTSYGM